MHLQLLAGALGRKLPPSRLGADNVNPRCHYPYQLPPHHDKSHLYDDNRPGVEKNHGQQGPWGQQPIRACLVFRAGSECKAWPRKLQTSRHGTSRRSTPPNGAVETPMHSRMAVYIILITRLPGVCRTPRRPENANIHP